MLSIKSFEFSPIRENTYILYNEFNECAIIDPGCYYDEEKDALVDYIKANGLKPVFLINTHCHLDHVFGNKFVAEKYGLELHIHKDEDQVLAFAPSIGLMYNLPFDNYSGTVNYLAEGKEIKLGNDVLEVLHTPGHSPGSISFYCRAQNFVISGDVLFKGSVGRTDLPGGDFATLEKSIKEKLYVLPDETSVFSGHGPVTTIGSEKVENAYVNG